MTIIFILHCHFDIFESQKKIKNKPILFLNLACKMRIQTKQGGQGSVPLYMELFKLGELQASLLCLLQLLVINTRFGIQKVKAAGIIFFFPFIYKYELNINHSLHLKSQSPHFTIFLSHYLSYL